ncbi:MAG: alpha/beta hydrolase, partial [Bradyrhizobium sp.]
MVGGDPRFHESGFARLLRRPGLGARSPSFVLVCGLIAISLCLAQCSRAPRAEAIAAGAQASSGASFDERFPAPQFEDRFPTASESLPQLARSEPAPKQTVQSEPASYQVASLEPMVPSRRRGMKEDLTTLVSMKSSAFPYYGDNPTTDTPFLNVTKGDRRGHRTFSGRVYWQDQTYNDSRVLVHIPEGFDIHKPGVIVVFFHGNGATLERDVRNRQMVPQQISDSGANAVLLAPQMAVDAFDSSAGKFWQPDGFKRFIKESADHLARLYGDPGAAKVFANMPIVIVGYSGGFLPTAWS